MSLRKYIKEILSQWVNDFENLEDHCLKIESIVLKDKNACQNLFYCSKSDIAVIYYRVAEYVFYKLKRQEVAYLIADYALKITNIYISPKVNIGEGLLLEIAENTKIYENVRIGKKMHIVGKVIICSKTNLQNNNCIEIGDNFSISHNACVRGNIKIGNNVCIDGGCTVLDNIDSDCEVKIVSSLQMLYSNKKNLLPSQKIFVYGVVPKFKNQIVIYGEGFYNPIVDIKIKQLNKNIESEVSYWDKNTIIIKVKPINIENEKLNVNKIIIKSNGYKCVVNNSMGLVKILR